MATEKACIDALRASAAQLGESPTKAQYEATGRTPSASTILRHCGGWNDAKEKAGLATTHSTGTRTQPKPDGVSLPVDTTWADLSQDQRWHYKNRAWNGQRTKQRRKRLRAWVAARKTECGCGRCGETDPVCLDFHHLPGTEKVATICDMITHGYGEDELRAEIEKCAVLCANCHRKEHAATYSYLDRVDRERGQTEDGDGDRDAQPTPADD